MWFGWIENNTKMVQLYTFFWRFKETVPFHYITRFTIYSNTIIFKVLFPEWFNYKILAFNLIWITGVLTRVFDILSIIGMMTKLLFFLEMQFQKLIFRHNSGHREMGRWLGTSGYKWAYQSFIFSFNRNSAGAKETVQAVEKQRT